MIFGLILILLFVIFLAFFIGKNLTYTCTIWFFKTFTDVPVSILVFVAFAAGIVLAVLCMLINFLKSPSSGKPKKEKPAKEKKEKIKGKKETDTIKIEQTQNSEQQKINKRKSFLKKTEKAAKNSDNSSDATIVADPRNLS